MNSFNYSALTTAYRCNKLYQYLYIDKLTPPGPESADMKFGSAIHLGVEEVLCGNDGLAAFNLFWDIERNKNNRYTRSNWDDLKNQGEVFLSRFERLHAKKFVVTQMEQRLYGTIGDIHVEGTPDFLGSYNGKASVVDFKTSSSRYSKDKIHTAEQLYLYSHLARQVLNYPVEQILYIVFIKGKEPSIQTLCGSIDEAFMETVLNNVRLQATELISKEANNSFTRNLNQCIVSDLACPFFKDCLIIN